MDEPFSAVDPVVREELQTEILRLQSELQKTIVFVTHDIDEALKLGDKVAVFGRGGVLQQYDEPSRLLSNPANDFVAGFIGADRGYRGLQFRHATGLPLHDIRTVAEAEIDGLDAGPERLGAGRQTRRHAVRLDQRRGRDAAPQGQRPSTTAPIGGGSLFRPDDSLRQALDAALSSPSGLGVAVDDDGQARSAGCWPTTCWRR